MKKHFNATRMFILCVFAAGIFASCSRQTAYNSLQSHQLQAQQISPSGNNQAEIAAIQNVVPVQQTASVNEANAAPAVQTKMSFSKRKNTIVKTVKNKLLASSTKKAIRSTLNKNLSFAMHTSKMGAKADPDNGLAAIGVIFLVLGILSFVIPPLFFIGLTASAAQSLVIVSVGLAVLGLLFLATGLARKAEKP